MTTWLPRSLLVALAVSVGTPALSAAQVSLTPVADTSLWQRESWKNAGASDMLPAGYTSSDGDTTNSRMLLRFDVATAVPPNAILLSATLHLTVVRAPSLAPTKPINGSTFQLHQVLLPWGEGTKTYTNAAQPMQTLEPATAGEATWRYRLFGDESKLWSIPGGDLTDGDFAEEHSGEVFVGSGSGGSYALPLLPKGLQDLRDWLATPTQDFGWMLRTRAEDSSSGRTGTARLFGSREHAVPEYRPRLVIDFVVPSNPPRIESISRAGTQTSIRFAAEANTLYQPQRRSQVDSGDWTTLPALGPNPSPAFLEFVDDSPGAEARFYRLLVP